MFIVFDKKKKIKCIFLRKKNMLICIALRFDKKENKILVKIVLLVP